MENKIKLLRNKYGWTQTDLSKKTGLSVRTIQRLESGKVKIKGHSLQQLIRVFGEELEEKETFSSEIELINLSALSFIIIPFGNLIFPILIWNKKRKENETIDTEGRKIVNIQINWQIMTILGALLFILIKHLTEFNVIFLGMISLVFVNIAIIILIANQIKTKQKITLKTPIRLL